MNKLKLTHIITVALSIGAMLLPWGAVLRFVTAPEGEVAHESLETYSYFDPTIYGYANFAPFLCAILTSALFLVLVLGYFTQASKGLHWVMTALSGVAFVLSILPLVLYGFKFYNMTALAISYLLVCSLVMSVQRLTGKYFVSDEEEEE